MANTKKRQAHFHGVLTGLVRDETWHDRPHLVAPAVLVREMVLGEDYLPAATIAESARLNLWNGKPVTLAHPKKNGGFGLVGDLAPADVQAIEVGRLWNVREQGGKLKGEIWVDVELANQTEDGQRLVGALEAHRDGDATGQLIEGSTGYLAMVDTQSAGIFGGSKYNAVQTEIIPDHFAVLLDQLGRCSVADGCGLPRLNSDGEPDESATPEQQVSEEPAEGDSLGDQILRALANIVSRFRRDGNASVNEMQEALRTAIRDELGDDDTWVWLEDQDLDDDQVIWIVQEDGKGERLFRAPFNFDEDSMAAEVDFDAAVEVVKRTEYIPLQNTQEDEMEQIIEALTAVDGFPLTAEQLGELDEEHLTRMANAYGVGDDDEPDEGEGSDPEPEANDDTPDGDPAQAQPEEADAVANARDCGCHDIETLAREFGVTANQARGVFAVGLEELERRDTERKALAKELGANADCDFSADELMDAEQWTLEKLQKLNATVRKPVYGAAGGPRRAVNHTQVRASTPPIVTRQPAQN